MCAAKFENHSSRSTFLLIFLVKTWRLRAVKPFRVIRQLRALALLSGPGHFHCMTVLYWYIWIEIQHQVSKGLQGSCYKVDSDLAGLEWSLGFYIFEESPGLVHIAGSQTCTLSSEVEMYLYLGFIGNMSNTNVWKPWGQVQGYSYYKESWRIIVNLSPQC